MGWFEEQARSSPTPYGAGRSSPTSAARGGAVAPIEPGYTPRKPVVDPSAGGAGLPTQEFRGGASPTASPAPAGGGYQSYSDGALQAILQKYSPNNDGVRQAYAEVERTFGPGVVTLLDHPERLDKFVTPTGTYDTVEGAGGANPSWGWMREGAHGGGGTLGGMVGGGLAPVLGSPMAGRSWQDDPGVAIRLGEGLKALERSAAAKGTLLTGGAAKGLMRFAQDYTSMEYGNAYNRAAQEQGNNFNRLFSVGQLGANATGNAQQLASGYADRIGSTQIGQGNAAAGATQAGAAANADTMGTLGNLAGQWLTNRYGKPAAGAP